LFVVVCIEAIDFEVERDDPIALSKPGAEIEI
jgi:hypothetical protein